MVENVSNDVCDRKSDDHFVGKLRSPLVKIGTSMIRNFFLPLLLLAAFSNPGNPQLVSAQCNPCWLVTQGSQVVNASTGTPVKLRSVGLGGWLLQEGYMLNPGGCDGCPGTQWQLKLQYLNEGQSIQQVEDFYQGWRDNFITKADIDYIASLGFNSVRLPMHYELFLTDTQRAVRNAVITNINNGHDQYKAELQNWLDANQLFSSQNLEGFRVIDRLLQWCADNDMYVILDLHAAPGAQGSDLNICDGFHDNNLWQFPVFQDVINELWLAISDRYKSEPRIAMYEFFNEPNNNPGGQPAIHDLTQRLISTVRANGDTHLIGLHGGDWGNNYNYMEPWTFSPNWGLVYSCHRYGIDPAQDWIPNGNPNFISLIIDMINFRDTYNVPIWCGETGENSNEWLTQNIAKLENEDIGWAHWTYKRFDFQENAALMRIGGFYPTDGSWTMFGVLNNIQFDSLFPNFNTIAAVTSTLPPAGTTGCSLGSDQLAPIGQTIYLRGSNGRFVSSEDGLSEMTCNRNDITASELFKVVDAGEGKIALQGANGLFVSCENGQAPMNCDRAEVAAWERFDWVDLGAGQIGLRGINGRLVSSENGTAPITCNRDQAEGWERFEFFSVTDSVVPASFQVNNGVVLNDGGLAQLQASDNDHLNISQLSFSFTKRDIESTFSGVVTEDSPASFTFAIEASVEASVDVDVQVEFFNYDSNSWEIISSTELCNLDNVARGEASGNLSRFIAPGSNQVSAKCVFKSAHPVFTSSVVAFPGVNFDIRIDHIAWLLD